MVITPCLSSWIAGFYAARSKRLSRANRLTDWANVVGHPEWVRASWALMIHRALSANAISGSASVADQRHDKQATPERPVRCHSLYTFLD